MKKHIYRVSKEKKSALAEILSYLDMVIALYESSDPRTLTAEEYVQVMDQHDKVHGLQLCALDGCVPWETHTAITETVEAYEKILATPVNQRVYRSC